VNSICEEVSIGKVVDVDAEGKDSTADSVAQVY
ncbi:hypothetical protein A2U01_0106260, partial [Trifolium medium]|nr:hypothetical protein [Trifolium medium]